MILYAALMTLTSTIDPLWYLTYPVLYRCRRYATAIYITHA
jgi:hypothetical protein